MWTQSAACYIEFESVQRAIEAYDSPEYQAALAILKDSAERDVRIISAAMRPDMFDVIPFPRLELTNLVAAAASAAKRHRCARE
jgi:hypothetical protein